MIEQEKKGSPWPWILVPLASVSLFFVLRECRQTLPAAEQAPAAEVTIPATPTGPAPDEPRPSDPETAPASSPVPQ
jgi:hypothetical protein